MKTVSFEVKVRKEEHVTAHTQDLDTEKHKRIMNNDHKGDKVVPVKILLEQPEELNEIFEEGEVLKVTFEAVQTKLKTKK